MTDGVSLEIAKRQHILMNQGYSVATMAGPGSSGADYVLPSMDFNSPIARKIADNAFGEITDYPDEQSLMLDIEVLSAEVEAEIEKVIKDYDPDFILLHNIFFAWPAYRFCCCISIGPYEPSNIGPGDSS